MAAVAAWRHMPRPRHASRRRHIRREPPISPSPPVWTGDWNAATIVFGVRNSSGVIARGGTLDLVALAQSNWGALAECRGFVNCPNSDLAGVAIKTVALAEASGSGRVYQSADGGSGVARYQLTAAAHARDVARRPRSALTALLGESSAKALTFPGNQPHHVDPSGSRTDYAVGGYALAEDYGVFSCREAACDALDHTVYAKASHSEHYGQRACPYAGNEGASFSACTGRGGQCKSNRAEWCADAGVAMPCKDCQPAHSGRVRASADRAMPAVRGRASPPGARNRRLRTFARPLPRLLALGPGRRHGRQRAAQAEDHRRPAGVAAKRRRAGMGQFG